MKTLMITISLVLGCAISNAQDLLTLETDGQQQMLQITPEPQESRPWGRAAISVQGNILPLPFADYSFILTGIGLSAEMYWGRYNNWGAGVGYIHVPGTDGEVHVAQLAGTFWKVGQSSLHFETRLGALGIIIDDEGDLELLPWPILTVGARFQKPDGKWFTRLEVGTMGLGLGTGIILR